MDLKSVKKNQYSESVNKRDRNDRNNAWKRRKNEKEVENDFQLYDKEYELICKKKSDEIEKALHEQRLKTAARSRDESVQSLPICPPSLTEYVPSLSSLQGLKSKPDKPIIAGHFYDSEKDRYFKNDSQNQNIHQQKKISINQNNYVAIRNHEIPTFRIQTTSQQNLRVSNNFKPPNPSLQSNSCSILTSLQAMSTQPCLSNVRTLKRFLSSSFEFDSVAAFNISSIFATSKPCFSYRPGNGFVFASNNTLFLPSKEFGHVFNIPFNFSSYFPRFISTQINQLSWCPSYYNIDSSLLAMAVTDVSNHHNIISLIRFQGYHVANMNINNVVIQMPSNVYSMDWHKNMKCLFMCCDDGLHNYNLETKTKSRVLTCKTKGGSTGNHPVVMQSNYEANNICIVGYRNGNVLSHDLRMRTASTCTSGTQSCNVASMPFKIDHIESLNSGIELITQDITGRIAVFDIRRPNVTMAILCPGWKNLIRSRKFWVSPDERFLVSSFNEHESVLSVGVWDIEHAGCARLGLGDRDVLEPIHIRDVEAVPLAGGPAAVPSVSESRWMLLGRNESLSCRDRDSSYSCSYGDDYWEGLHGFVMSGTNAVSSTGSYMQAKAKARQ